MEKCMRRVPVGAAKTRISGAMHHLHQSSCVGWRQVAPRAVKMGAIAAIVALILAPGNNAAMAQSKDAARDTANTVSLDADAPNSYRNFAPELGKTLARVPKPFTGPPPANFTGLHVEEVKPNLFYVTDGIYQSAFVRTGDGIIVFDVPPSLADKYLRVIEEHAPREPIKFLLYSHNHADHIGGSIAFSSVKDLKIVAPRSVADTLARENHPGILKPNTTFEDKYSLSLGRETVEIKTAHFHSEVTDAIIFLPKQKFIVAVDTITPGDVPFMNFGATSKFGGYVELFDELLRYDFDTILSGHTSILGAREDVLANRDYVRDVRDTAMKGMAAMQPTFEKTFAAFGKKQGNLAYRVAMEKVRGDCSKQIIDRWKDKLSVVDVWADSHCETAILHAIMH
jgi:glyoxylase-like metal-dependent hydrolase (beta-lactamase superfamily II)